MKQRYIIAVLAFVFVFTNSSIIAQESYGGHPYGLLNKDLKSEDIPSYKLSQQNKKRAENNAHFAQSIEINGKKLGGIWTNLRNGEWMWQLRLENVKPVHIALMFSQFEIPSHARLFIYSEGGKSIMGAYTRENNESHHGFLTDLIYGESFIIEYVQQSKTRPEIPFKLERAYVSDDYLRASNASMEIDTGFMASLPCHPNANCEIAESLSDQKRSICRILMVLEEGLVFCTGTLMNNTLEDQRPLILSALHCEDGFTPMYQFYRFDFNFLSPGCDNPAAAPTFDRLIGCEKLASHQPSDMLLLDLNLSVPGRFNSYYSGWDWREDYVPQPSSLLHHPLGDIMKVSIDNDDMRILDESSNWDNGTVTPPNSHFRADLDIGSQQIGSSGGPLFDSSRRVVGQLHGGASDSLDCADNRALFGRLALSWEGNGTAESRLRDWLDPLESGLNQYDGITQGESIFVYDLLGKVTTEDGTALPNVEMLLEGDGTGSTFTEIDGSFVFDDVPVTANFTVTPRLNDEVANGVSATDLVVGQQKILALSDFTSDLQRLAADVNVDGTVSVSDLVQMARVILGLQPAFSAGFSWGFLPASITFPGEVEVEFKAYKLGDLNQSARISN